MSNYQVCEFLSRMDLHLNFEVLGNRSNEADLQENYLLLILKIFALILFLRYFCSYY